MSHALFKSSRCIYIQCIYLCTWSQSGIAWSRGGGFLYCLTCAWFTFLCNWVSSKKLTISATLCYVQVSPFSQTQPGYP
uniref:Uncharacterized protein n=1 Tax=Anguilla anguilla TaxID=7936 RepID=A0A0E9U9L4_ANGAN